MFQCGGDGDAGTQVERDVEEVADEEGARNVNVEKTVRKSEGPQPMVFVRKGDRVFLRKVTTGIRDDRFIEIIGGLKAGEAVVSGSYKAITKDLKDSSMVTVNTAKSGAKNAVEKR